jgi:hypothetical protein
MAVVTRRQKRRKILVGGMGSMPVVVWLALSVAWFAVPLYLAAMLTVRLLAWPTICRAYRTWPTADLMCEAVVTGTVGGCGSHREKKARDLRSVLGPRHPRSPIQAALRLVSPRQATPERLPELPGAPIRVTFENALIIYAICLCMATAIAGGVARVLIG